MSRSFKEVWFLLFPLKSHFSNPESQIHRLKLELLQGEADPQAELRVGVMESLGSVGKNMVLGGGFECFSMFTPIPAEMIQFH